MTLERLLAREVRDAVAEAVRAAKEHAGESIEARFSTPLEAVPVVAIVAHREPAPLTRPRPRWPFRWLLKLSIDGRLQCIVTGGRAPGVIADVVVLDFRRRGYIA